MLIKVYDKVESFNFVKIKIIHKRTIFCDNAYEKISATNYLSPLCSRVAECHGEFLGIGQGSHIGECRVVTGHPTICN